MKPSAEEPATVKLWRREQLALAIAYAAEYRSACIMGKSERAEEARAKHAEALRNIEKCERALRMRGVPFVAISPPALRAAPVREIVRIKEGDEQ